MINKIYKSIHNKYSRLFKFLFFLRYLAVIFFIFLILFLTIPNFFDYEKKEVIIKSYLLKNYDLKINSYENIKYNSLPTPHLELQNVDLDLNSNNLKLNSKKLNIYLKLMSIYNFDNLEVKKIIFNNSDLTFDVVNLKILTDYIYRLKKKLSFTNLELDIRKQNYSLINLKKIKFSNYGYRNNIIEGEVFKRKFKMSLKNNFKQINFKLLNTGIFVTIDFAEETNNPFLNGKLRAKILNSNLKFQFQHNGKMLKINNLFFRNKDLSFESSNIITHQPFFEFTSDFILKDFNTKILNSVNLKRLLKSKKLIKKLNSKNTISYNPGKFTRGMIESLNLNINFAYGTLVYSTNLLIPQGALNCRGDLNLVEEYYKANFDCSIKSEDKRKFLKNFSIKHKPKNEPFNLSFKGSLNISNNKINFENILMGKYLASKEDLKYFSNTFKEIVIKKDFLNIFRLENIKMFVLEIL